MTKLNDDEQIFGDFVASSLRNLQLEVSKRRLKRRIQQCILDCQEEDDNLEQKEKFPKTQSVQRSDSACSSMTPSLLDISRSTSTASYYENFDSQFAFDNTM